MEKKLILWFLFACSLLWAESYDQIKSFEAIKTLEDQNNLQKFEALYTKAIKAKREHAIPKIMHFIWIGSRELTSLQKKNIISWISHHPDWKVFFWSDKKRKSIHRSIEYKEVFDIPIYTKNLLEKELLHLYEVLNRYGGVFVHPDLICQKTLDEVHENYSFFGQLMLPKERGAGSSVLVNYMLLGASKNHPILKKALLNTQKRWNEVQRAFQFPDLQTEEYRFIYRGLISLQNAIFTEATQDSIVFSPNELYQEPASLEFFKGPIQFDEKVQSYIQSFIHKSKKNNYVLITMLFFLMVFLYLMIRDKTLSIKTRNLS